MLSAPAPAAARARAWLFDAALPLWAERGFDARTGLFQERLDFQARPYADAPRRMRVQARQIFVFSEADRLGWDGPGADIVARALAAFERVYWAADGRPGWSHLARPDGEVCDATRDLYDHAFALFALAHARRIVGDSAEALARRTLAYVDQALGDPDHGGFRENDRGALPRRSNPHMHLLEAMLAWRAATGAEEWRARAVTLLGLFRSRFFDARSGVLREYFEEDWRPAAGAVGAVVEPGHHFEWCWLLAEAERLGAGAAREEAAALHRFALAHGLDAGGFALDELDDTGRVVRPSRRAWPQTELIKAQVAAARAGNPGAAEAAAGTAEAFLDSYLGTETPGLWMDQFDGSGAPMSADVPASTLYHVVLGFGELAALAQEAS